MFLWINPLHAVLYVQFLEQKGVNSFFSVQNSDESFIFTKMYQLLFFYKMIGFFFFIQKQQGAGVYSICEKKVVKFLQNCYNN